MLRGVNRQIIEITNTESTVFEKVVLYIRPEYADTDDMKIEKKARVYISSLSDDKIKTRNKKTATKTQLKNFLIPLSVLVLGITALLIKYMFF